MSTRWQRVKREAKELILFSIGSTGIVLQYLGEFNVVMFLGCMALVGVKSVAELISLVRNTPIELQKPSSTVDSLESTTGSSSNTSGS